MSYKIISFDGGGVRGIIPIRFMQRLSNYYPYIVENSDLLAGTSTGAIISLAIADGVSLNDLFDLYKSRSRQIFSRSSYRKINAQIFKSKYDNDGLKKMLYDVFGEKTLGDLKKRVLICSFDLDSFDGSGHRTYKPKFFHNLPGRDREDLNKKVVDVALASSAAPTYFPSYNGFVDGGIVANNPSVAAIAEALDTKSEPVVDLQDIVLLSMGAGKVTNYVPGERDDWGYFQWSTKLIEMMMNGSVDVADYECKQLLKSKYLRINPYLLPGFGLDSVDLMEKMIEIADEFDLTFHSDWVKNNFN